MKCESCGYNVPDGYEVCPNCHKILKKNDDVQQNFGTLDNTSFKDDKLDLEQYVRNPDNKKKLPIIFGSLVMGLIVLIIVFGLLFVNKKDDRNYFIKFIDDFFEKLDETIVSNPNNTGHYKLIAELPDGDYKIEGDYEFDIKEKLASLSVKMEDPNKQNESIILESDDFNASLYLENNKLYVTSKDLIDYPVLISIEDKGSLTNKYNEKTILYSIQSALGTAVKSEAVTRKKEVINFHGEKLNVKSQKFTLSKTSYQKMIKSVFDSLAEDYSLINELKRMTGLEKDDLVTYISKLGDTLKYSTVSSEDVECVVYYKKGKVYRLIVNYDDKDFTIDNVDDTNYYFTIKIGEVELYKATLNIIDGENDEGATKNYVLSIEDGDKKYDFSLLFSNMKSKKITKQKIENAINFNDIEESQFERYKINVKNYFNNIFDKHLNSIRINSRCYKYAECQCTETLCNCIADGVSFVCPAKIVNKGGNSDEV